MADGNITIKITVDGKEVNIAADELDKLGKSGRESGKGVGEAEKGMNKAGVSAKQLAISLGLVKIASAAFNVLKQSLDSAISRFDTLNKFPKVLQSLGVSAEDSQASISRLSDGIDGLPTKLDDIASNAQRMYISFKDMDKATDSALALNNAFLASGSSGEAAASGTEQYIQALQKGKPDMMEWRNMQQNMSIALERVAEQYGMTTNELGAALRSGEISMDSFNDKLIELGSGTGELAELARTNSMGLATSFENLKNAAARGMADLVDSFNKLSVAITGKEIAENIDSLKVIVNSSFKAMGSAIEATAPIIILFVSGIKGAIPVVNALTPAILGLVAAYAAYTVITKASAAIQASNATLKVAQASKTGLTLVTKAHTVAITAETGAVTLGNIVIGVMTGQLGLLAAAKLIATAAAVKFSAAMTLLSGPIGWVVGGIGLLVTGTIAVVKWLNRSTEEGERLASQTEELVNSTDALNSAVEESSRAYESNQKGIKASAETNLELANTIDELANKENKSAAEKKELQSYIDELNNSVHGLNLEYGEQANALNMTSEQIQNKINLMKEEEQLHSSQERLTEIIREQNEIQSELDAIIEKRKEWDEALKNNEVTNNEYGENIELLEEKEGSLSEAHTVAGEERLRVEGEIIESSKAVAEAAERDIGKQILLYENLPDSVKNAVDSMKASWDDYMNAATDMFNTISDKSETSVSEMIKNLEENQRVISEWSENIAKLAERGVDEGLLETLREAGPSSAGHVKELVNASDTELNRLSEVFSKGGEVATDALITSVGEGAEEVMDEMGYLVESASTSLSDAIQNADFESIGIDITDGLAGGIEEGTPEAEKASENLANKTIEAAEEALGVQSPSKVFEGIGTDVTDGLVLGISNGTSKVINEMKKLAIDMLDPFKNIETDFNSIGRDAMAGLNSGLSNGRGSIMTTARNIASSVASTMRNALQIQSPSRVTKEIGEDTGQGLADGIDSKQRTVSEASKKMAESVATMMKNSIKEMNSDVETATKEHNKEIEQMEKRHVEDVETIRLKASEDKRALTREETIRIERMIQDHNKKILDMEERATKEREKIVSDSARELVSIAEKYVDKQIWLGEMSIKEEVYFWSEMVSGLEEGTEEYEQTLKNHQNAVKRLRNEMEKANEDYSNRMIEIEKNLVNETKKLNEEYERESKRIKDQMISDIEKIESAYERSAKSIREQRSKDLKKTQDDYEKTSKKIREQLAKNTEKVKQDFEKASADINKKLTDDINKLNQEYENAYKSRVSELTNITGLFERYHKKSRVPEGHLIRSLESQVKALEEYSDVMGSLDERIDNEDLMNELKALGPDSLAELEALNRMSDDQLAEFVGLYEERFRLAKEQANKELEPMKKEIEYQMQEINIIAANELDILKENADIKLKELNEIANSELITLKVNTDNQLKEITRNADNELRILKNNTRREIREIRENAYEELEILKENTDEQLKELNKIAEEELTKLEKEWIAKIEDIVNGTEEEFDRLYDIGADAIRGLEEGMLSQESSLRRTAERIADSVSGTIRGALDINSPSRLMRDEVGKMIPAGIALGIKDNAHLINKEMMGLSRMIVATPEQALGLSGMRYNGADTVTHTNTISNDNSKVYNPVIKNYFTKDESTPSEVARKNKQQQQRLAMEWGF